MARPPNHVARPEELGASPSVRFLVEAAVSRPSSSIAIGENEAGSIDDESSISNLCKRSNATLDPSARRRGSCWSRRQRMLYCEIRYKIQPQNRVPCHRCREYIFVLMASVSAVGVDSICEPSEAGGSTSVLPLGVSARDLQCPICRETIHDAFCTPCGHSFCYSCLTLTLGDKPSCPSCGAYMTQESAYPNFLLNNVSLCASSDWVYTMRVCW